MMNILNLEPVSNRFYQHHFPYNPVRTYNQEQVLGIERTIFLILVRQDGTSVVYNGVFRGRYADATAVAIATRYMRYASRINAIAFRAEIKYGFEATEPSVIYSFE